MVDIESHDATSTTSSVSSKSESSAHHLPPSRSSTSLLFPLLPSCPRLLIVFHRLSPAFKPQARAIRLIPILNGRQAFNIQAHPGVRPRVSKLQASTAFKSFLPAFKVFPPTCKFSRQVLYCVLRTKPQALVSKPRTTQTKISSFHLALSFARFTVSLSRMSVSTVWAVTGGLRQSSALPALDLSLVFHLAPFFGEFKFAFVATAFNGPYYALAATLPHPSSSLSTSLLQASSFKLQTPGSLRAPTVPSSNSHFAEEHTTRL
ncbi:hypothetical protein C8F04DRAFT_1281027 [Mycena alexandri]|uniref:Uncharacterized protein n=1 Tax=Mycena alexandri TaxID=1745969 RepID=A0AAD6WPW9_9AGAR|nr:hypothetical protein C8F04DRAFT_1281027 [Mycena alexandri]